MIPAVKNMLERYKAVSLEENEQALKEVIQEIALLGMWRAKFFEVGGFYGGTALRILHGLGRFSEDLDFSLLSPNSDFDLAKYEVYLTNELQAFGFRVTVKKKNNSAHTAIESAFIKANTSLHLLEVAPRVKAHSKRLLKIKIEVDTQPPGHERVEVRQHFRPVPFSIKTFTLPTLFAGKIAACLFRPYRNRVKGRDWYDFLWYISRAVPVSLAHLAARAAQVEGNSFSPFSLEETKDLLHHRVDELDIELAKDDVFPFVRDRHTVAAWSKELFHGAIDQLTESCGGNEAERP